MTPGPKAPAGLGKHGRALWHAIVSDLAPGWVLDSRELHLLAQACVCADRIAALDEVVERDGATVPGSRKQTTVHPAITESRQLRLAQLRLLAALELEDPAVARARMTPVQRRAAEAAAARWGRGRLVEGSS